MGHYSGRIERATNVALIVVSLLLGATLVKRHLLSTGREGTRSMTPLSAGSMLQIPGADLTANEQTLLIALSPACRYCSESAPFYQRLAKVIAAHRHTQLVALLPPGLDASRDYLNTLRITPDVVSQTPLNSVGIKATPTIVLAGRDGRVKDIWVGKLSEFQEYEVLGRLRTKNGPDTIKAEELKSALEGVRPSIILDVAERSGFTTEHIAGAKNIPADELEIRAKDELPSSALIVIYCGDQRGVMGQSNESVVYYARQVLLEYDYKGVLILQDGLEGWRKAGLPIVNY